MTRRVLELLCTLPARCGFAQAYRTEQMRLVAYHRDWVTLVLGRVDDLGGRLPCGDLDTALATLRKLARSSMLSPAAAAETFCYMRRWVPELPARNNAVDRSGATDMGCKGMATLQEATAQGGHSGCIADGDSDSDNGDTPELEDSKLVSESQ